MKIKWYVNRLLKMNIFEIVWRIKEKVNCTIEFNKFKKNKIAITSEIFNKKLINLKMDINKLSINLDNKNYSLNEDIYLLGGFDYRKNKYNWNVDFETNKVWPNICSYKLNYKSKSNFGDARINWELNRHYQFAILAKKYYITRDKKVLNELLSLFNNWNGSNKFLYGLSWIDVMEIAIRCNNWCYTYFYLSKANVAKYILNQIENGIINMTNYIYKHHAKYSSANNHLIVESFVIGQSGILFNYKPWINFSINTLDKELTVQNYSSGINKEMSLHYHAFYMEAMELMIRLMYKNNINISDKWYLMLEKMADYLANSINDYQIPIEFGDNDEGKILDLNGKINYYEYILGMSSILLDKQYIKTLTCENLNWLFNLEEKNNVLNKAPFIKNKNICYKDGGVTYLSSLDNKLFIGIDHGELGFGKLAAHGHADALSFQLNYKNKNIFLDLGTYCYHSKIDDRNYFKKTINHNTVSIDWLDQSTILGAFMWGKRAKCKLEKYEDKNGIIKIVANHNGYKNNIHTREFIFNKRNTLVIKDSFQKTGVKIANFNFASDIKIDINNNIINFSNDICKGKIVVECSDYKICIVKKKYSKNYGKLEFINSIEIYTEEKELLEKIYINGI